MAGNRLSLMAMSAVLLAGCRAREAVQSPAGKTDRANPVTTLTLATTTSTRDSGLLDVLEPMFEQRMKIELKVVAVGTGQALEMGRRGDADVLMTHTREAEQAFVEEGFGTERVEIMYNDFVLVGRESDPAGVRGSGSAAEALAKIAAAKAIFVSRGDNSGTHMKEQALWKQAGLVPAGEWYLAAGSGMAATLRLASEKSGYTLTDRGTFLAQRENLALVILAEGDPLLHNMYAVIPVNPDKHPHVQIDAARKFVEFMQSDEVRDVIEKFGVEKFGQPLFFPVKLDSP